MVFNKPPDTVPYYLACSHW